ncbi:hypothetical protein Trydic_g13881 [Trypoxylus dichotomus]
MDESWVRHHDIEIKLQSKEWTSRFTTDEKIQDVTFSKEGHAIRMLEWKFHTRLTDRIAIPFARPMPGNDQLPMETTKSIVPTAFPAGAETYAKEATPPAALSVIDIKPSIFPDELIFRALPITRPDITTTVDASISAPLPVAKNTENDLSNYRRDAARSGGPSSDANTNPPTPSAPTPEPETNAPESTKVTKEPGEDKETSQITGTTEEGDFDDEEWAADKTIDWIYQYLESMSKRFPKTTKLIEIGKSKGGLPIFAVEIIHKINSGATIVIDAGYDASDRQGINLALYVINELIARISRNLLTLMGVKIIIVPMINPDNYNRSITNIPTEPCRETLFTTFEIGDEPVDPCPGFFREVETVALAKYYQTISKFKLYFSLDSGAAAVGYPYGFHIGIHEPSHEMGQNMANVLKDKLHLSNIIVNNLYNLQTPKLPKLSIMTSSTLLPATYHQD